MTFGSEYIKILENYANEQEPDFSGEWGVDYDRSYVDIKLACSQLAKMYKSEKKIVKCYPCGQKALWKTFIPIERSDYDHDMVDGVTIEVLCVTEMEDYFNISIVRSSRPHNVSYMKDFDPDTMEMD